MKKREKCEKCESDTIWQVEVTIRCDTRNEFVEMAYLDAGCGWFLDGNRADVADLKNHETAKRVYDEITFADVGEDALVSLFRWCGECGRAEEFERKEVSADD